MYLQNNIKLLRQRMGVTQEEAAQALDLKRTTLSGYENGVAEPNVEALTAMAAYYKVTVDELLKEDISQWSFQRWKDWEQGNDPYITGSSLRILTSTLTEENEETVELVGQKASAGYTYGFGDPEYIGSLPAFNLPFLSQGKKYRAFQIEGDSMLPIPSGSYVIGEYVADWRDLKSGHAYILLTTDGLVFKVVQSGLPLNKSLTLVSLNPLYDPYQLDIREVREVWRFNYYISAQLPNPTEWNGSPEGGGPMLEQLKSEISKIKSYLKLPPQ